MVAIFIFHILIKLIEVMSKIMFILNNLQMANILIILVIMEFLKFYLYLKIALRIVTIVKRKNCLSKLYEEELLLF